MKTFLLFLLGLVIGAAAVAGLVWTQAGRVMVAERASPVGLDETVARLEEAAKAEGWVVQSVIELEKSIEKNGGGKVRPIRLVNLCQAQHAAKMMNVDAARPISVFMPCTISVYEKSDGKIYVSSVNAEVMGKLLGGVVAEVMGGEVAEAQEKFLEAVGS
jgi:uncharacterized protein (DUF302 family)